MMKKKEASGRRCNLATLRPHGVATRLAAVVFLETPSAAPPKQQMYHMVSPKMCRFRTKAAREVCMRGEGTTHFLPRHFKDQGDPRHPSSPTVRFTMSGHIFTDLPTDDAKHVC